MNLQGIINCSLCGLLSLLLSGCYNYKQAEKGFEKTKDAVHFLNKHPNSPPVLNKPEYYVNPNVVDAHPEPAWMHQNVSLRAFGMPLNLFMGQMLRFTEVNVSYDKLLDSKKLVNVNYHGDVAGALSLLRQQINYAYEITPRNIHWAALDSRTFNIAFMPGNTNYMMGQAEGGLMSNNGGSSDREGGRINQLLDQQYSNLRGQLSVWDDVRLTLDQLKSAEGSVITSESTTSVTVHDHPVNVDSMARYIERINKTLSQQVAIEVMVLDVETQNDSNYGINWDAVATNVFNNTSIRITGNLADQTNLVATELARGMGPTAGVSIGNTLIAALEQQGRVSVVNRPSTTTLNNQIATMRVTRDIAYLQSVSTVATQNFVTTTVQPGVVTEGLILYVLPKIVGNNVYLQISSTLSNLIKITKQDTRPNNPQNKSTKTGGLAAALMGSGDDDKIQNTSFQAIETPSLAEKQFNQRSVVPSGSTLIIAGYKQIKNSTAEANFFLTPLGGRGAQKTNVETIVLITPKILPVNPA